jgi:hypothetical protein
MPPNSAKPAARSDDLDKCTRELSRRRNPHDDEASFSGPTLLSSRWWTDSTRGCTGACAGGDEPGVRAGSLLSRISPPSAHQREPRPALRRRVLRQHRGIQGGEVRTPRLRQTGEVEMLDFAAAVAGGEELVRNSATGFDLTPCTPNSRQCCRGWWRWLTTPAN